MTAVLVSAKVSVFYSKIKKTFPKSSQRFYLAQTLALTRTAAIFIWKVIFS